MKQGFTRSPKSKQKPTSTPWMPYLGKTGPIVLIGLIITALLFICHLNAQQNTPTVTMNQGDSIDLRGIKPKDFNPAVVVGRFYVENLDPAQVQALLESDEKVLQDG